MGGRRGGSSRRRGNRGRVARRARVSGVPSAAEPAWITVVTRPPGLRVRVGDVDAGWSPLAPVLVAAGRVTVRAFPADPRRFDPLQDGVTVDVAPGETLQVALDLRPHPLLT